jgi:D-glycero-D-manno-heptose 1,7-bisphosphate phosphatase
MKSAAFLDRDGTLIEDAHYLSDVSRIHLLPGAADAVRRLNDAGVLAIVVTNQSGIAQGLITEAQYEATRDRLAELLRGAGARLDAQYHCPHYPSVSGACECRKPGTGLFRQAARDHQIALDRSLYVGDRRRDVEPGVTLGGCAVLVPSTESTTPEIMWASEHATVDESLQDAVTRYLTWLESTA